MDVGVIFLFIYSVRWASLLWRYEKTETDVTIAERVSTYAHGALRTVTNLHGKTNVLLVQQEQMMMMMMTICSQSSCISSASWLAVGYYIIVSVNGIIIINNNNKAIRPATTETEHKSSNTLIFYHPHSISCHFKSHPDPHHLHLMLWELKDPLQTSRLRRRGLGTPV